MRTAIPILGMMTLIIIGVALSANRRAIKIRTVASAFGLLLTVAALILYVPIGKTALSSDAQLFTIMVTGMAAPAGLLMAKILYPETNEENGIEADSVIEEEDFRSNNVIAAAATGAANGTRIAVSVGAMLIAFIGLLSLLNGIFGLLGSWIGIDGLSFEGVLGYLFSPIAWLMGVQWSEAQIVGNLIGKKTILNEFVAYVDFVEIKDTLSAHSQAVVTFALCGFANIASIAVLVGSLGSIAPGRRDDVARMGLRALAAATLANLMSATLASFFLIL